MYLHLTSVDYYVKAQKLKEVAQKREEQKAKKAAKAAEKRKKKVHVCAFDLNLYAGSFLGILYVFVQK